jgi:hypothetical protein
MVSYSDASCLIHIISPNARGGGCVDLSPLTDQVFFMSTCCTLKYKARFAGDTIFRNTWKLYIFFPKIKKKVTFNLLSHNKLKKGQKGGSKRISLVFLFHLNIYFLHSWVPLAKSSALLPLANPTVRVWEPSSMVYLPECSLLKVTSSLNLLVEDLAKINWLLL